MTLIFLQPPASPMSHLLIDPLSSPWLFAGTPCALPLSSLPLTPKGPTFTTHTIEPPAPLPCRNFPTPWDLPPPVELVSLASPILTFHAWCFAVQPANNNMFGIGVVPYIRRLMHSPLSCISPPRLGWTPFTHILPPSPHPSAGAVSMLIYGTFPTEYV